MSLSWPPSDISPDCRARAPIIEISMGELCSLFDLTPRAVRFYEERGLIRAFRDRTNRRRFDAEARRRLQIIATLRRADLPLVEIEALLASEGPVDAAKIMTALTAHREKVQRLCRQIDAAISELGGGW